MRTATLDATYGYYTIAPVRTRNHGPFGGLDDSTTFQPVFCAEPPTAGRARGLAPREADVTPVPWWGWALLLCYVGIVVVGTALCWTWLAIRERVRG